MMFDIFIHNLSIKILSTVSKRAKFAWVFSTVLLGILGHFLCAPLSASGSFEFTTDEILKGNKCHKEISQELKNFGALSRWRIPLKANSRNLERQSYLAPTKSFAQWARLDLEKGKVTLWKLNPKEEVEVHFAAKCAVSSTKKNLPPRLGKDYFTDQDLRFLLKKIGQGLIYIWTPHNTLWESGVSNLEKTAQKLGLPIVVLLGDEVSAEEEKKLKANANIKKEYFRKVSSVELKSLGGQDQFPALIFYKEGRLHADILYGVKNPKTVEDFLRPLHAMGKKI